MKLIALVDDEERDLWLKALAALLEDQGLILSTHIRQPPALNIYINI